MQSRPGYIRTPSLARAPLIGSAGVTLMGPRMIRGGANLSVDVIPAAVHVPLSLQS